MENSLVLGVDNSLDFLTLVLSVGSSIIEERHIGNIRPPSQILPSELFQMLVSNGYKIHDLSHIVVTTGPGSFTGIRVALAFVKGLNAGADIPVTGIPTLDVLASSFSFLDGYHICPVVDAKKGEVFTSRYRVDRGKVERSIPYLAIKVSNIVKVIKTPCVIFGSGIKSVKTVLSGLDGVIPIEEGFSRINGGVLIREGLRSIKEGKGMEIKPIYCRRSEAEIKFDIYVTDYDGSPYMR